VLKHDVFKQLKNFRDNDEDSCTDRSMKLL